MKILLIIYSIIYSLHIHRVYSGWGFPSNFWNDIFIIPTPHPTPRPTHSPTPPPKTYYPDKMKTICQNCIYRDNSDPCRWDGAANTGWDVYSQYLGSYDWNIYQHACNTINGGEPNYKSIVLYGPFSGDHISDPEPRTLSRWFRCATRSYVKVRFTYLCCSGDYNDYFEMYFQIYQGSKQRKHFVRCPSLCCYFGYYSCYDHQTWTVTVGTVNAYQAFMVSFKISPTYWDDLLGVGNIEIECDQVPTPAPTPSPTPSPSPAPTTRDPTPAPTNPTRRPSRAPTLPTSNPTWDPTREPTQTDNPTKDPTIDPTHDPTYDPSVNPTWQPTYFPSVDPTLSPTRPTAHPSVSPTYPTNAPTLAPSIAPSISPSFSPSIAPTQPPSIAPTGAPTHSIQIVDIYWYDDYIYNEKIAEYENFEIGWTVHNANMSITRQSHMWQGEELSGTNNLGVGTEIKTITKMASNANLFADQIFHGPYWSHMMEVNSSEPDDERNYISLFRDFECKSQSYVTLWYNILFCDHHISKKMEHSLEIKSWDDFEMFNASINVLNGSTVLNGTGGIWNISDTNITEIKLDNNNQQLVDNNNEFLSCSEPLEMIDIKWHSNYTAFDDRPWKLKLEFELLDLQNWFMLFNFSIYCDLKYPSAAPTQAPSGSPSQPPTTAPTYSPTLSPTTCPDFGNNYTNVDGEDHIPDPWDYISYVQLGVNKSVTTSGGHGAFIARTINCSTVDVDGCEINCNHGVSCLVADVYCDSPIGCNINCLDDAACGSMEIFAMSTLYNNASLTLVCAAPKSCGNIKIYTSGLVSVQVHCMVESACSEAVMYFDRVSIYNNTNSYVACYTYESCSSLTIFADGKYTQLRMYEYSSNVAINNGYGYYASLQTITCGFDQKYIKWDPSFTNVNINGTIVPVGGGLSLYELIERDFTNGDWPCKDVTIWCERNQTTGINDISLQSSSTGQGLQLTGSAGLAQTNCLMEMYVKDPDPDLSKEKFANAKCVYVWLEELVELQCKKDNIFTCGVGDPTAAPTPSPTNYPTYSPTLTPSIAPSISPSIAPTLGPSPAPSFAPSIAPSIAPSLSPSIAPSISPSIAPSIAPTQPPTAYPTFSPTQAPTRTPTRTGNIYDSKLNLIYVFTNFTLQNYEWLLHNETDAVYKLSEFVERQYFDLQYLPSYTVYMLTFEKINGIPIHEAITMDILLNKVKKPYPEIHARAVIEFERAYENWIVKGTSKNPDWAEKIVTPKLREYMNNSNAHFSVGNYSGLEAKHDLAKPPPDYGFWAINIFLGLCILVGILAMLHNKKHLCGESTHFFLPVDNGYWLAMIVYGLQIYDMVSDINLTYEIFGAISNRECTIITGYVLPCAQDENCWVDDPLLENGCKDDPESVDTFQEYALIVAGIFSLTFLFLPYGLNVAYAARIPSSTAIKQNHSARAWFETYQSLFITLVVFSGGCYPALNLVSSNIFGLAIFNTGLSSFELSGLSDIRVITTVLTENGPQLLVQILYSYSISALTQNTILAFTTSIMSIVASVLNYFINKDKSGQVYDVFYYLELKLKQTPQNNTETKKNKNKKKRLKTKQIKHVKTRKGMKLELAKQIVKIYPDVDIAHFEIGFVTIRRDNIVIRCCQHLHEQDLNITIDDADYAKYKTETAKQNAKLRPFKNYCYELFAANRESVEEVIFEHYPKLNRNKYQMIYHKEYPTDKNLDKILHGAERSHVFRDLINEHGGRSQDFDGDEDIDIETGNTTKKKKKKKKNLVSQHRDQFKLALDLLNEAVSAYQYNRDKNDVVPKSQINKWKHLLQSHDIHHLVIADVLDFAVTSQLFIKDEKHESDIDSSDESIEMFKDNEEFMIQQKKIRHARMLDRQVVEEPSWFVTNDQEGEGEEEQKEGVSTKSSFWNAFSKAKKDKKKKKKKKKGKGNDSKLKRNIELSKNVNTNNNNIQEEEDNNNDGDDGDMETELGKWAMES